MREVAHCISCDPLGGNGPLLLHTSQPLHEFDVHERTSEQTAHRLTDRTQAVEQMAAMGIEWVLLGHSERRGEFGLPTPAESNALLATKLAYVGRTGPLPYILRSQTLPQPGYCHALLASALAYTCDGVRPNCDGAHIDGPDELIHDV